MPRNSISQYKAKSSMFGKSSYSLRRAVLSISICGQGCSFRSNETRRRRTHGGSFNILPIVQKHVLFTSGVRVSPYRRRSLVSILGPRRGMTMDSEAWEVPKGTCATLKNDYFQLTDGPPRCVNAPRSTCNNANVAPLAESASGSHAYTKPHVSKLKN